jgi:DNA-directed RNA polymerase subunit N (RpoN/RPB10)
MSIPIKCFTCGTLLADKDAWFQQEVVRRKVSKGMDPRQVTYLTSSTLDKSDEGNVLDELGLTKPCCRTQMMTRTDPR